MGRYPLSECGLELGSGISLTIASGRADQNAERALQNEALRAPGRIIEYRYNGQLANRALELLGREISMFIERHEVGGAGDFARMSDDELRRVALLALGHAPEGGKPN